MVAPTVRYHSSTSSANASRPISSLLEPSFASRFSITFCVAIAAWSVPGRNRTSWPVIRLYRAQMSCTVPLSAWPMCSSPVTLGGGRQMVYFGFVLLGSAVKRPAFSQRAYQPGSTAPASYAVGMSVMVLLIGVFGLRVGGQERRLTVA